MAVGGSLSSDDEAGLETFVMRNLQYGLAAAARATDAWLFTGGMDTGIMSAAGAALVSSGTPCIGVAVLEKVTHHEIFRRGEARWSDRGSGRVNVSAEESSSGPPVHSERRVHYVKRQANSDKSAGLDSNHSHFVLVDGCSKWRDEINLRAQIEHGLCSMYSVPYVTLVVGGGSGTLETICRCLSNNAQVILVRESGGAAQALSEYIEPLLETVRGATGGEGGGGHGGIEDDEIMARLISESVLDQRDEEFYDRLRQLLGWRGEHDSLSDEELRERGKMLRSAASHCNLLSIYSVRSDAGRALDESVMNAIVTSFKLRDSKERIAEQRKSRRKQLLPLEGGARTHLSARSAHPQYPQRKTVPDERVEWRVPWPSYSPTIFTHKKVLGTSSGGPPPWADAFDPRDAEGLLERQTAACKPSANLGPASRVGSSRGEIVMYALGEANVEESMPLIDPETGVPRNPRGRTGMTGRGLLGRWGPSEAADLIATRFQRDPSGKLRLMMLAVQRKDTAQWAIPGGFVMEGQRPEDAARNEFTKCCGDFEDATMSEMFERHISDAFEETELVFRGYVDDPRNTDNAWIETSAFHIHLPESLVLPVPPVLPSGSDAEGAQWITVDAETEEKYASMYGNHKELVDMVADTLKPHMKARAKHIGYPARLPVADENVRWAVANHEYKPPLFTSADVLARSIDNTRPRRPSSGGVDPRKRRGSNFSEEAFGLVDRLVKRSGFAGFAAQPEEDEEPSALAEPTASEPSVQAIVGKAKGAAGDADPTDISLMGSELRHRLTYEAPIVFEPGSGVPVNPRGRTGLRGRAAKPGAPLSNCLRHALLRDVLAYGKTSDERLRLEQLLEEMIGSHEEARKRVVYQGYIDDARNTDNAWMETTACHFHCSRELGALLPLSDRHKLEVRPDSQACYWVDLADLNRRTLQVEGSNDLDLLNIIHERQKRQEQLGLLEVVASWGRNDFLQRVLQSPVLLSFRRPEALAAALQRVLQQASDPSFDVALVATLLEHGATTSDLYLPDLFSSVIADPFSYFSQLKDGRYDAANINSVESMLRAIKTRYKEPPPASHPDPSRHAQRTDGAAREESSRRRQPPAATNQGPSDSVRSDTKSSTRTDTRDGAASHRAGEVDEEAGSVSEAPQRPEPLKPQSKSGVMAMVARMTSMNNGDQEAPEETATDEARSTSVTHVLHSSLSGWMAAEESSLLLGGADDSWLLDRPLDQPPVVSPWHSMHINFMSSLVPGFEDYAPRQRYVRTQDLVVWALAAGRMELAHLLWVRCQPPLRSALIAAKVCDKIAMDRNTMEHELHDAGILFTQGALGILGNLPSLAEARKLLLCDQGEFATLGLAGSRRISVLDLAIRFDNKDFVADRFCQRVLDELWWGHSSRCGAVRLRHEPSLWRIYASPLAMLFCVQLLPIEMNDAYSFPSGSRGVPVLRQMIDVWRIPLIKRSVTTIFYVIFLGVFVFGFAFLPMCGPLTRTHFVAAAWLLAIALEEAYLAFQSISLWRSNRQAILFATALVLLFAGCILRWHQRNAHLRDSSFVPLSVTQLFIHLSRNQGTVWQTASTDNLAGSFTDNVIGMWDAIAMGDVPLVGSCPASIEDEILRTIIGLGILPLFMRLFELLDYAKGFGVILVCMLGMLRKMLSWMVPMLFLDLAFSTSFSVMAPNYHAENSGPPLRFFETSTWDLSTGGSFWLPFWGMFGIIGPQEVGASEGCVVLAPFLLWFYLLIALVLFINLLIAMFNETYVAITEKSEAQWKMMRVNKVKAYYARYPAPAPLIVPCLVIELLWMIVYKLVSGASACCVSGGRLGDRSHVAGGYIDPKEAALIEQSAFERYMAKQQHSAPGRKASGADGSDAQVANKQGNLEERFNALELTSAQRQAELLQRIEELSGGRRSRSGSGRDLSWAARELSWSITSEIKAKEEPVAPPTPAPVTSPPPASVPPAVAPTPAPEEASAAPVQPERMPRRPGQKAAPQVETPAEVETPVPAPAPKETPVPKVTPKVTPKLSPPRAVSPKLSPKASPRPASPADVEASVTAPAPWRRPKPATVSDAATGQSPPAGEGSPAAPAEAPVVAAPSGAEVARPLSPLPTVASSVKKVRAVNRAGRLLREPKSGATSEVIRL